MDVKNMDSRGKSIKGTSAMWRKGPFPRLRGQPFLGALCIGLLIFLGAYLIQQIETKVERQHEQTHADKRVLGAASFLSSSMVVRLNLTSALNAFVTTHQDFSPQEFDRFASMLKRDLHGVMSLQLAPRGVVTYLTDLERNRKALGHDLLADPKRRATAEKSIRERSYIISGPIDLIQGGQAIIARRPMFFSVLGSETEAFWGFATVLIDIDSLLSDTSIVDLNKDFNVAIRGKDGLGVDGEVFIGNPSTFDSAIAISDIILPNARWQIAVADKNLHMPNGFIHSFWFWVTAVIATIVSSTVAYIIIDRPRHLEQKVRHATESLVQEVHSRKKAEDAVRHMAHHDSLTGLPNRRLFDELSKQGLATAKRESVPLAVLFIDIDGFKAINDSFGHSAGDRVLRMIAERLKERVRESDVVARFGGDEFVMLIAKTCDAAGAQTVATAIIDTISKPYNINDGLIRVGASIGIAMYPDHGATIEELLQKSDAAMYAAKNNGKNCYRFSASE